MKFLLVIVTALLVPFANAQTRPQAQPDVSLNPDRTDRYPALPVRFASGVVGLPSLVYSEPEGYRRLTLDLYLPPASRKRPAAGYPLIVYIHGGGWRSGNSRLNRPFSDFPAVLASLATRGYVVASVEYRLSGEARFPAQIQDVKAAIRWLRSRASIYHIDPARAMTWGVSAGGYLSALAAVTCGVAPFEPASVQGLAKTDPTPSDCVQGAVSWYGLFDLASLTAQAREGSAISRDDPKAPEWLLLGCFATGCTAGQIAAASPITYVNRQTPPLLLIAGDSDRLIPYQQTLEMAARLAAVGAPHTLIVSAGADHNLIGKTLDATREANGGALDQTFRFFDDTFGAKR